MTVGSLFAGIGGFDLGFERAGFTIRWQVEIDPWARAVLTKHWPTVPKYPDVREVGAHTLEPVDVLCGGFPCQDISLAGKGAGIEGQRSGLWAEYARLIGELRPRYVVVENVAALRTRGLDRVLGDLAACGYDAEWDCVPASAVGAPHRRDRLWLVAYPHRRRQQERGERHSWTPEPGQCPPQWNDAGGCGTDVADTERQGLPQRTVFPRSGGVQGGASPWQDAALGDHALTRYAGWWEVEPPVGRVVDGLPQRVDRLRGLGNAIVPQIAEWIARRILTHAA